MNRSLVARASTLLCLFALPIAACAVEQGDEAESTEAELRRLDASEIVGTIAYGETKTIAYAEEPRYRALSFTAAEGDEIDARFVGVKSLDPIGYLLDSKFKTLEQNDDESSTSHASHFTYKITKAGKYYLAVREANEDRGQISISLGKIGGATPTPTPEKPSPEKPTPSDVFAPESCTGNTLSQARAIKYFPKGSASGRRTISSVFGRAYLRARTCSEFSGCSGWTELEVQNTSTKAYLSGNDRNYYLPSGVELYLSDRANDPVDIRMPVRRSDISSFLEERPFLSLEPYTGPATVLPLNKGGFELFGTVNLPLAVVGTSKLDLQQSWSVVVNETCAQARFSGYNQSDGKQQRMEMQGVFHWDLVPPPVQ